MSGLRVEGVGKRKGAGRVLDRLDLEVPEGAIVALLGSSGCGKTTLLRLIAGFDRCDEGRIVLGGTLLDGPGGLIPPERRGIGYVPQEGLLFPHLAVGRNVGFGLSRAQRRSGRIGEALRLVGLDSVPGIEARHPHQLSGGQQQRLALARALAPRPRLVLLDEPFNGLDQALRRKLAADVASSLRQAGATAILVTHDPSEAFASADTVAVLRTGRIVQHAPPATVYRQPFDIHVARLTGPTVELDGTADAGGVETALGRIQLDETRGAGGPCRVLLRPEQLTSDPDGMPVRLEAAIFGGDHTVATVSAGSCRFDLRLTGDLPHDLRVRVSGPGRLI